MAKGLDTSGWELKLSSDKRQKWSYSIFTHTHTHWVYKSTVSWHLKAIVYRLASVYSREILSLQRIMWQNNGRARERSPSVTSQPQHWGHQAAKSDQISEVCGRSMMDQPRSVDEESFFMARKEQESIRPSSQKTMAEICSIPWERSSRPLAWGIHTRL